MQQFKVGDHVIVDEGGSYSHRLNIGFDAKVAMRYCGGDSVLVEGYSDGYRDVIEHYVHPNELIKVDDLVTRPEGKFGVGDRVLITGDNGNAGHHLALADARIIEALDDDREYFVTGLDNQGDVNSWYVNERDLEAEPTFTKYVSFSMPREYAVLKREVDEYSLRLASQYARPRRLEFAPTTPASLGIEICQRVKAFHDIATLSGDTSSLALVEWFLTGAVPASR